MPDSIQMLIKYWDLIDNSLLINPKICLNPTLGMDSAGYFTSHREAWGLGSFHAVFKNFLKR